MRLSGATPEAPYEANAPRRRSTAGDSTEPAAKESRPSTGIDVASLHGPVSGRRQAAVLGEPSAGRTNVVIVFPPFRV